MATNWTRWESNKYPIRMPDDLTERMPKKNRNWNARDATMAMNKPREKKSLDELVKLRRFQ